MQLQKIFLQILYIIGPRYAWTMLTQFDCQSAKHVKNTVVIYYIHLLLRTLFHASHVYMWAYFVRFIMLRMPYLNYLKSLTSQFSTS